MMIRSILTFFLITIYTAVNAQSSAKAANEIKGVAADSITGHRLEFTAVSLMLDDGFTPYKNTMTDSSGSFSFTMVAKGKYKLSIAGMGYRNMIKDVSFSEDQQLKDLGIIKLNPESIALDGLVLKTKKELVSNKIDKIVYNAEKDVTSSGGTAVDMLRKIPMVSADSDGNISIKGDSNVKVLINGKPTGAGAGNLADILRSIPSDQIKNIEVVTTPSAKYDAEGSGGVINIITKTKTTDGFTGSVSGGLGTRESNFNGNFNYNEGRFSLSANLGFNSGWPRTTSSEMRQQFNTPEVMTLQLTNGNSRSERMGYNPSLNLGYEISDKDNITMAFKYNDGKFENSGTSKSSFTDYLDPSNNTVFEAENYSLNQWKGFDWNADYSHKFSAQGHEFTLSAQWSRNDMINNYSNYYTDFYTDQSADNIGKNNEYTFQGDYALPITEHLKVETGGKAIIRKFRSNYISLRPDGGEMVYDPANSNLYDYNQNVAAGYAVGTLTLNSGYTIMAGGRFENTAVSGSAQNEIQTALQPFSISYETFIPSLTLQKSLSDKQSLKITYSKRITRPSMNYLNPFINRRDIQAQSQGNPDLTPEVSQTIELGYGTFTDKYSLNASVYYRNTSDLIETITVPLEGQSGTMATYQNIGENNSAGLSFFGSANLFKMLALRGNFNTYTYRPRASAVFSSAIVQNNTYLQYTASFTASLTFENGVSAEVFTFQNSQRRTIQGTNPAFSMVVIGAKKQFWEKKASLGVNIVSPFKRDLEFKSTTITDNFSTYNNFSFPWRSFGLTFSYSFGSSKSKAVSESRIKNDDLMQNKEN